MSVEGEDPAGKVPPGVPDFSLGEFCAAEAVQEVLDLAGKELYKAYIERKAFPYAADRVSDLLVDELRLRFVRHDRGEDPQAREEVGEDPEDWSLEPEPVPRPIDSWARACVPIRKKYVTPGGQRSQNRKTIRGPAAGKVPPSAGAGATKSSPESSPESATKPRIGHAMIPLIHEQEEDQEEAWMRDMKEKESKRKREEEARVKRKAAEDAEEQEKLAKQKGELASKPCSYDTDGNMLLVQPLAPEKLPNHTPSAQYKFRPPQGGGKDPMEGSGQFGSSPGSSPAARKASKLKNLRGKKDQDVGFTDSFQRLQMQQPPVLDTMTMAPGVVLKDSKGRSKKNQEPPTEKKSMSRKDYEQMIASEKSDQAPGSRTDAGVSLTVESTMPDFTEFDLGGPSVNETEQQAPKTTAAPDPPGGRGGQRLSAAAAGTTQSTASPPSRLVQKPAQPPPNVHNPRARLEAIGYRRGERERIPTSGAPAAGNRNYFPPPPIGATMGHGLMPKSPTEREKEFFFPEEKMGEEVEAAFAEEKMASSRAEIDSPKSLKMGGQIHAPNRELMKRLFR